MAAAELEKKTLLVIVLTLITMVVEISVGMITHSMALTADGWHMGTHAFALSITFFAYYFIRKYSNTDKFVFGTGKFGTLAGFASSILLGITGIWIVGESVERFIHPLSIQFNEAIVVAIIGLLVNVASILIMEGGNNHAHCHGHGKKEEHEDFNFKAAYLHILADALTSVFAIAALIAGRLWGWTFLDSLVGVAGGVLICSWSFNLIKSTSAILLDKEETEPRQKVCEYLSQAASKINYVHVWRTSDDKVSVAASICGANKTLFDIKNEINNIICADFINIEINCD